MAPWKTRTPVTSSRGQWLLSAAAPVWEAPIEGPTPTGPRGAIQACSAKGSRRTGSTTYFIYLLVTV